VLRDKYGINPELHKKDIKIGLITADLYNETTNPQIKQYLKLLDYHYVTKPECEFPLSNIVSDLKVLFSK